MRPVHFLLALLIGLVACSGQTSTVNTTARDQATPTAVGTVVAAPSLAAVAAASAAPIPSAAPSAPPALGGIASTAPLPPAPTPIPSSLPSTVAAPTAPASVPASALPSAAPPTAPPSAAPTTAPPTQPPPTVVASAAPSPSARPSTLPSPSGVPRPPSSAPPSALPSAASGLSVPANLLPAGAKVKESRVVRFEHPAILYQLLVLVSGNENSTDVREEVQIFKGPGQSTPWTLWYRFPTSGDPGRVTYTVAALEGDATEQVLITSLTPGTGGYLSYRLIGADNGKPVTLLSGEALSKGGAKIVGQTIETREAIYAPGEPNCCPSKVEVTVYGWNGKAFVVQRKERVPNQ